MAVHRGPSTKWLFTREQLENTPSRRCGIEADRELSYRQQAANLIQDIGQRLNIISQTTLFLAAKVEEQPRKLEHVIKIAHAFINPSEPALDTKSSAFQLQAHELVVLESIVLQTLGFEITVDHPHTDVVRCSQLVRASRDLAQTSYFMATNSLHLTTFCLQHRPTVVACVCIHLACKWSNWEIPVSTDGKNWWEYVDRTILERTPSKLKRIRNWRAIQAAKKPKSEGSAVETAYQGTSLDSLPAVANSFFSSTDAGAMPGLNSIPAPYSLYQNLSDQFSQPPHSDFTLVKHKHKAAGGGGDHQQLGAAAFSRSQKVLTLEKYREKQAAELQNGVKEEPGTDMYIPPAPHHHHHKKHDGRREKPGSKKPRAARRHLLRRRRLLHQRGVEDAHQSLVGAPRRLGGQQRQAQKPPPLQTLVLPHSRRQGERNHPRRRPRRLLRFVP
ncbi:Cyclin-T2 [Oryzias melastigma]|uniref:Cyclin-T2 n=1 Tax=Oryzias melastigma TaxID=30732 RepID=A0A834CW70_ORYME|nr:Cyclin-T2 [Oryzias melastigma]